MEENLIVCNHCGEIVPSTTDICPECGKYVNAVEELISFMSGLPAKGSKRVSQFAEFLEDFNLPLDDADLYDVTSILLDELAYKPKKKLRNALDLKQREAAVMILALFPEETRFFELYAKHKRKLKSRKYKAERKIAKKISSQIKKKFGDQLKNPGDMKKLLSNKLPMTTSMSDVIKGKIKDKIKDQIKDQIKGMVSDQVKDFAKDQTKGFIWGLISSLWD